MGGDAAARARGGSGLRRSDGEMRLQGATDHLKPSFQRKLESQAVPASTSSPPSRDSSFRRSDEYRRGEMCRGYLAGTTSGLPFATI